MNVFETVLPILCISLLGYAAARWGLLSKIECSSISKFTFNLLIPCLLFIGTSQVKFPSGNFVQFLLTFYLGISIIYIFGCVVAKFMFKQAPEGQSVIAMGCAYSNATIIGIPVCAYVLGKTALLPLFILISVHNLVLFTIGIFSAERATLSLTSFISSTLATCKQLALSPITGSLIAGGVVNLTGITIYQPLIQAIDLISQAAVPAALFVLGASLNAYTVKGHIIQATFIAGTKIIILPFLTWLLLFVVYPVEPLWAVTALLMSAMPVGISAFVFSQKYTTCQESVASGIVLSSVLSIFTLSIVISYVQTVI